MSKALEALERMVRNGYVSPNVEELKIIETALKDYNDLIEYVDTLQGDRDYWWNVSNKKVKELKALEIIKMKKIDVGLFYTILEDNNQKNKKWSYNFWQEKENKITKEEFDLLKEVLL